MSGNPAALPGEPEVNLEQALAHGLSEAEFRLIERRLGRTPTFTELGVFSVMWSEHCSYKSSRRHLARLPNRSSLVAGGPGENAIRLFNLKPTLSDTKLARKAMRTAAQ